MSIKERKCANLLHNVGLSQMKYQNTFSVKVPFFTVCKRQHLYFSLFFKSTCKTFLKVHAHYQCLKMALPGTDQQPVNSQISKEEKTSHVIYMDFYHVQVADSKVIMPSSLRQPVINPSSYKPTLSHFQKD